MPVINDISLSGFRSYDQAEFSFDADRILLLGENGSGKSNLLEAIGFLSVLRSFRGARTRELFRVGSSAFTISAGMDINGVTERLTVREDAAAPGKRELYIGRAKIARASEFIREFRVVSFAPEDHLLASGSSACRRRFFDMLISMLSPEYFRSLARYQRALAQRNRALKFRAERAAVSFEEELAEQAVFIMKCRRETLAVVEERVSGLLNGRYGFTAVPRFSLPEDTALAAEKLALSRPSDLKRGCTQCGPQQDDFDFKLENRSLRYCGSNGQHRLLSLLLKLAGFSMIRSNSAKPVVVIADDVTGELDRENRQLFYRHIASADQLFFAAAVMPQDEFFRDIRVIRLGAEKDT